MHAPASKHSALATLFRLAWPIVLARATQSIVGFTDALMTAPLGEERLAAVTTGAMNIFCIAILPMGTVFILQSFAAQLRGRGDLNAIPRYAYYGLVLAAITGVAATIAIPAVRPMVMWVGYDPQVEQSMSTYVEIRLLSVAAIVGVEALGNWYGGLGNTRPAMVAGVISMVVNVILNYALILPRWGLPGYGVAGAAWASVVASWAGFGTVLVGFAVGAGYQRVHGALNLQLSEFKRVLRFGLPNGFNWFMEFAAFIIFINFVVGHLGTTALAAFNVVMNLNSISFMPAFGVASAGAILSGEAIGRRRYGEVRGIVKLTMTVTGSWMGFVGLCYLSFPTPIFELFTVEGERREALLAMGSLTLGMSALWQLFDAVGITLSEALRAAGDTTWCMWARLFFAWAIFTPLSFAAVMIFESGMTSIMLALVFYMAALAAALAFRFLSNRWQNIDMVGEPSLL